MNYKILAEFITTKELVVTLKEGETDATDPNNWASIDDRVDLDSILVEVLKTEAHG